MLLKQLFLIVNFCVQEGPIRNENFLWEEKEEIKIKLLFVGMAENKEEKHGNMSLVSVIVAKNNCQLFCSQYLSSNSNYVASQDPLCCN